LAAGVKAIGVTEFGGPGALHVVELPDPEAGPGQVRIRVRAAAVNPTDTGLRSGARAVDVPPPYVPGMDVAGVLEQIGPDTSTDLQVGDQVMAIVVPHGQTGGYAERVVVPAESVARVPAGATDAATVDEQLVKDLGADVVVGRGPDFAQRVREAVPQGADGLVDAALLNELIVPAVRDGGRIATVRGFKGQEERGITFHPVTVRSYAREHGKLAGLRQLAETGQLTLRVARVLPAEHAAEAHRILEAGGTRGRLVLEF
jgi:NADPH2:quinone reductase